MRVFVYLLYRNFGEHMPCTFPRSPAYCPITGSLMPFGCLIMPFFPQFHSFFITYGVENQKNDPVSFCNLSKLGKFLLIFAKNEVKIPQKKPKSPEHGVARTLSHARKTSLPLISESGSLFLTSVIRQTG